MKPTLVGHVQLPCNDPLVEIATLLQPEDTVARNPGE